jgi:AraC-like DNA-binding protein
MIDAFLSKLEQRGLLSDDPLVRSVILGETPPSTRSIQRHFGQVIGLTPNAIRQIDRARKAVELLQQGIPITEVANGLGYADQAHTTRILAVYWLHSKAKRTASRFS